MLLAVLGRGFQVMELLAQCLNVRLDLLDLATELGLQLRRRDLDEPTVRNK